MVIMCLAICTQLTHLRGGLGAYCWCILGISLSETRMFVLLFCLFCFWMNAMCLHMCTGAVTSLPLQLWELRNCRPHANLSEALSDRLTGKGSEMMAIISFFCFWQQRKETTTIHHCIGKLFNKSTNQQICSLCFANTASSQSNTHAN